MERRDHSHGKQGPSIHRLNVLQITLECDYVGPDAVQYRSNTSGFPEG